MNTDFALYFKSSFRTGQHRSKCWIRKAGYSVIWINDIDTKVEIEETEEDPGELT